MTCSEEERDSFIIERTFFSFEKSCNIILCRLRGNLHLEEVGAVLQGTSGCLAMRFVSVLRAEIFFCNDLRL